MNYGRAIKIVRSTRDLTQQGLGAAIGKNASFISRLENGARKPSTETLEAIATALHTPLYLLILLASDEPNLKGISSPAAQQLGLDLLTILSISELEQGAQQ